MDAIIKFKEEKLSMLLMVFLIFFTSSSSALPFKFAIVGDFGEVGYKSRAVSILIKSWNPDFIITTGDNNYPVGSNETIDDNIGSLYSTYIFPYVGKYPPSPIQKNRFFPCLGNHDLDTNGGAPYLKYFSLPGNGRYYDFVKNNVHFFVLSSDPREPDGIDIGSKQASWLKKRLKESTSPWKIVYFHHPAYSSQTKLPSTDENVEIRSKNSERKIDFPFSDWGVSVVLNGHVHVYERFEIKGIPYVINGLGGEDLYEFCDSNPESLVRFSGEQGAILAEVKEDRILFKFITISGETIDEFSVLKIDISD